MFVNRLIGRVGKKLSRPYLFNHHIKINASLIRQAKKVKGNTSFNQHVTFNKAAIISRHASFWTQQKQNKVICDNRSGNNQLLAVRCLHTDEEIINLHNSGVIQSSPTQTSIEIGAGIHVENSDGRYINHSPTPNCHIVAGCVVPLQEISPGEELTFDYQKNESYLHVPFFCWHSGEYIAGCERRELNDEDIEIMREALINKENCADFVPDISYFTGMSDQQIAKFMQLFADFSIKRVKMVWPQDSDYRYLQIAKEYRIKLDFQHHRLDHMDMEDYFKLVGLSTDVPTLTPGC